MSKETRRMWIYPPEVYYPPNEANQMLAQGKRSDGQLFRAYVRFDRKYENYARKALLKRMDTFLDPQCRCVIGKNCPLHADMEVVA